MTPVDPGARATDDASPERALARGGVAGRHRRWSTSELEAHIRSIVAADRHALLGLDAPRGVTAVEVARVAAGVWGWASASASDEPVASVDPRVTVERALALCERIDEVGRAGGVVAFATGRPASMLPLHMALVRRALAVGAEVPSPARDTAEFLSDGRAGRRLRWLEGVAVVAVDETLVPSAGVEAGEELLFEVPKPDLLVGDRGFAAAAWRSGVEIAALVDFDALALTVVARADPRVLFVPLDDQRPPEAYAPLSRLVSGHS